MAAALDEITGSKPDVTDHTGAAAVGVSTLAAAMTMQLAAADPAVAASAASFLDAHTRIAVAQQAQRPEEHRLRMTTMRSAIREAQIRRLGQIVRIGMQGFAALIALFVLAGLGMMIRDAVRADGVIIEPFDTPPSLAARGLNGRVLASGILDALTTMHSQTHSLVAQRTLASAWSGDIKVEVPETGISVGEISRLLRERLGHETHIGGDLVSESDGKLTLTVRGDSVRPKAFTGNAGEMARLTTAAAEYIYGEETPYLYARYLSNSGRAPEALSFLAAAYPRVADASRPKLAVIWGVTLADLNRNAEAVAKLRLALQLDPDEWLAWGNLRGPLSATEGEEAALQAGLEMNRRAAAGAAGKPSEFFVAGYRTLVQDWPGVIASLLASNRSERGTTLAGQIAIQLAGAEASMHDWIAAARYLENADPRDPATVLQADLNRIARALESSRPADAFAPLAHVGGLVAATPVLQGSDLPCYVGRAYALTGHAASADAAFARGGRRVSCYSFHADNLERQGQRAKADAAYARAVALAPSLPFAGNRWGLALLARGDTAGALAKFAAASARGPHWADPLAGAGDALAKQGRWAEARVKYDAALAYAPNWLSLRTAAAAARRHRT